MIIKNIHGREGKTIQSLISHFKSGKVVLHLPAQMNMQNSIIL